MATTTYTNKSFTFGIEIETTGISQEEAARVVANATGGVANYNVATMADGRSWKCVRDGSVSGYVNAEVVSPICTHDDIAMVQNVVRALRAAGARVDSSTGIHVHVGVKSLPAQALVNLIKLVAKFEGIVGKSVAVLNERGRWCKPVNRTLLAAIKSQKIASIAQLKSVWYESHAEEGSRGEYLAESNHYDASRYHGLNLHSYWYSQRGTAEFRWFNATLHAGEVRSYIELCLSMVAKAANVNRIAGDAPEYNEADAKYRMRIFMCDLNMKGEQFEAVRKHLTKHLPGSCEGPVGYARPARTRRTDVQEVAVAA